MKRIREEVWLCLAAVAMFSGVLAIDTFYLRRSILAEVPPIFDAVHVVRILLVALASAAGVRALILYQARDRSTTTNDGGWGTWGSIQWHTDGRIKRVRAQIDVIQLGIMSSVALAIGMIAVWIKSPRRFMRMGQEDGIVEMLSVLVLLFGAIVFAFATWTAFRNKRSSMSLRMLMSGGLAVTLFLVAMEEISWFQRQLGIETPESFRANMQGELNLHNFATNEIENLYYLAVFVLLVVIPFVREKVVEWPLLREYREVVPARYVLYFGCVAASFNYDMWNIAFIQLALFVSLFVCIHGATNTSLGRNERILAGAIALYLLASQTIFLLFGHRFLRLHGVTEYKELLIPLALMMYAIDVLVRMRRYSTRVSDWHFKPGDVETSPAVATAEARGRK